MKYSKVHTCDFADEKYVESGNEFKFCDCDGIRLGVMICYDREYPESARVLMMKGQKSCWFQMIVVPCVLVCRHFPQGHMKIWLAWQWRILTEEMREILVHSVRYAGMKKVSE